jgi:hypothetical protein
LETIDLSLSLLNAIEPLREHPLQATSTPCGQFSDSGITDRITGEQ